MPQSEELKFLLGKRVKVKECIQLCYQKGLSDIEGKVYFIGSNEKINWPLQITIDRMPIKLNSLKQIELLDDEDYEN